jgi:small GTP-binding protein
MVELNVKILIVGDTNVGKTSLLLQYTDNFYPLQHAATVGIEFKVKNITYKNYNVKLQIWDTAGQERFHSITNNFFHNADGILFVYDITNQKSFEGIKNWIQEAEEEVGDDFQKILIGNKSDLEEERTVPLKKLEEFCLEKKINFLETSAKNNVNLKEAFNKIVELIFEDKSDEDIIREFGVKKSSLSITSKKLNKGKSNKNKSQRCC